MTESKELSYMLNVIMWVAVKGQHFMHDLTKLAHSLKCFIHQSVIMLTTGADFVGCSQIHELTKWCDKLCMPLAFFI